VTARPRRERRCCSKWNPSSRPARVREGRNARCANRSQRMGWSFAAGCGSPSWWTSYGSAQPRWTARIVAGIQVLEAQRTDGRYLRDVLTRLCPLEVRGIGRQNEDSTGRIRFQLIAVQLVAQAEGPRRASPSTCRAFLPRTNRTWRLGSHVRCSVPIFSSELCGTSALKGITESDSVPLNRPFHERADIRVEVAAG